MTHYEERLEKDLARIRERIADVGSRIERAVRNAVRSVLTLDRVLANETVLGDLPLNREIRELDRLCHGFVARHLPSAGHLRFVSSVLRLNVALERIGDYAVAISREAVQLSNPPSNTVARDIELLADQNCRMLNRAMQTFNEANAEMARGTMGMAMQLESTFDKVFTDLLREGEKRQGSIRDLFALLVVFNRLSRVGDQSKNICEQTIFSVTGEPKQPKVYRILFLDEKNDRASQIAEAFARKAFPESGRYKSAGWSPAADLDPKLRSFMDDRGYDHREAAPKSLASIRDEVGRFHVIVSLGGDARPHLQAIPFHTVLLEWDVGPESGELEETNKRIAVKVRELMEILRGEEAS